MADERRRRLDDHLKVRVHKKDRRLVERAAERAGVSISALVRDAVREAARETLVQAEIANEEES